MAKVKKKVSKKVEVKEGLSVKVKLNKTDKGRLTVTVSLLQDGVEIASDYDFVNV